MKYFCDYTASFIHRNISWNDPICCAYI
jgi:hypothetical protein